MGSKHTPPLPLFLCSPLPLSLYFLSQPPLCLCASLFFPTHLLNSLIQLESVERGATIMYGPCMPRLMRWHRKVMVCTVCREEESTEGQSQHTEELTPSAHDRGCGRWVSAQAVGGVPMACQGSAHRRMLPWMVYPGIVINHWAHHQHPRGFCGRGTSAGFMHRQLSEVWRASSPGVYQWCAQAYPRHVTDLPQAHLVGQDAVESVLPEGDEPLDTCQSQASDSVHGDCLE